MAEQTAVEALAEALFRSHQADFVSSAQRLVDDLAARGYRLVPEEASDAELDQIRRALMEWLPMDVSRYAAKCVRQYVLDAAPGAKEEDDHAQR